MVRCRNCRFNVLHEEDGVQYSWCLAKINNFDIDKLRECEQYIQATNGERIRGMSDEELAEWICHECGMDCEYCGFSEWCKPGNNGLLYWLKSPAEDGDT